MKSILLFSALLLNFSLSILPINHLSAQGYNFSSEIGSFEPLVGGTALDIIETDDQLSGIINLGFTFNYFNNNYTQVKVSSNGFITFNTASTGSANSNSFGQSGTTFLVAPLWDDLGGAGGTASYLTTGSAPNRVFTIEWLNWKWSYNASTAGISFQVRLYEGSNEIEFLYRQESGALTSPTASIGLVGSSLSNFYSLSNATQTPTFSPAGANQINTKPATGQIYSFLPNVTPITAPLTQATAITVNPIGTTSATINWTNGNGAYRAVFMKQTTSVSEDLTSVLVDNSSYLQDTQFGSFSSLAASGWHCVYNGTQTSVAVTNLQSGLTYRVQVVEYNGLAGNQKYIKTAATQNPSNFTTVLVAPGTPVSTLSVLNKTVNSVTLDITEGNGSNRVVFARATNSGSSSPADNTTYTANLTFGSGTQIGNTGWRCVFNGASTTGFTVTNLSPATTYTFHVIDYNGPAGQERFNIAPLTNNILQVTTFNSSLVPTYQFAATAGTFTPLVGGTELNTLEQDFGFSSALPIGFTFYHAGIAFTELKASSDGFVTFNPYATQTDFTNNLINNQALRPLIAPLWDDLDGSSGQASYTTTGTAPNRVFTMEWLNWEWNYNATSAVISFQLKLYETTNVVEFVYAPAAGALVAPTASIGMAFLNTGSGNFLSLNNATANPTVSTTVETINISTKPANGQVYTFSPQKLNQTITFSAITDKFFTSAPFAITASANSGLPVTFSSSNTDVATVSGNTVTITGVGSVTITASQVGNSAFNAAPVVDRTFIVNKSDQFVSSFIDRSIPFTTNPITITTTASSGLPVSYASSNPLVATVEGNLLTLVGVGETQITASQAGNNNYNAAADVVRTYTITKGNQVISFTDNLNRQVTEETFQLTATSTSNLPVSYESSNTSVATVSGSTVTLVSTGTANITASQAGDVKYNAANNVVRTLNVAKGNQTVTLEPIPSKAADDPSFEIFATASSGLPVTFTSSNSNVATISGSIVTIVGGGTTTISALQVGDSRYNAAPTTASSSQTLVVSRIAQTITAEPIADKPLNNPSFVVEASASSGLPISLQTDESMQNKVTIVSNTIFILKPGSVTVTVNQFGNDTYFPAEPVELTFCINPDEPGLIIASQTDEEVLLRASSLNSSGALFLWFKDGESLTTTDVNELSILEPGTYTVKVNVEGCISNESVPKVIVYTGLEPNSDFVEVFPNPVKDEVMITIPDGKAASLDLTDSYGKILETHASAGTHHISMKSYAVGAYLLKVQMDNRVIIKKLIKE